MSTGGKNVRHRGPSDIRFINREYVEPRGRPEIDPDDNAQKELDQNDLSHDGSEKPDAIGPLGERQRLYLRRSQGVHYTDHRHESGAKDGAMSIAQREFEG